MATIVNKTLGVGKDYSTFAGWEAGEQRDLTSADEIAQATVYNTSSHFTSGCQITGWTTDSTRYIDIIVPKAERHNGWDWTSSKAKIRRESPYDYGLDIVEEYVNVKGLIMEDVNGVYTNAALINIHPAGTSLIKASHILHRGGGGGDYYGCFGIDFGGSGVAKIWNCIGSDSDQQFVRLEAGTLYMYNCTAYDFARYAWQCAYWQSGGTFVVKNCIADCPNKPEFAEDFIGSFDAASDYNVSSDGTAPGSNSKLNQTPTYVNEGSGDFHLSSSDTVAKASGTNLYADANIAVTDDIDEDPRPSSGAFDIGGDQVPGGKIPVFMHHYIQQKVA